MQAPVTPEQRQAAKCEDEPEKYTTRFPHSIFKA